MKSPAQWSVENPVLVQMLMLAIIVGGVYCAITMVREMFPESRPNQVIISTVYPGATPVEVEKGVALRIEEAIKQVEHIDKIETSIGEGSVSVVATLTHDAPSLEQSVNDFKAAVDAISRDELPEEMESLRVVKFEPRLPVIIVSIFGDVNEHTLKDAGRRLRDDLLQIPGITIVDLTGVRRSELTVEVQPEKLVAYGLSLTEVSDAIRRSNIDLPGGQLKMPGQNIAVRTLGETDQAEQITETAVRMTPRGQVVRVGDLGRVIDGFEDNEYRGRFNGKRAASVVVYKTGDQDAVDIAEKVRAYVAAKRGEPLLLDWKTKFKNAFGVRTAAQELYARELNDPYPAGLELQAHNNLARFIEGRLELLTRNGFYGLILVFGSLLAFLNWRVAFWVMMGLIVSVCGALGMMTFLGETMNLLTMFGLIIVLGLLVDDAIVVGENVYHRVEQGESPRLAAVLGTNEVAWPVIIAVSTTVGAFLPLLFIEGQIGDFMGVLPVVVMCALSISLLEALAILPSHLAETMRPIRAKIAHVDDPRRRSLAGRLREWQRWLVEDVLGTRYARLVTLGVKYRYVTLAAVFAALLVALGMSVSGRVPFTFIQKMDSETLTANLKMPVGTPIETTEEAVKRIEAAALAIPEIRTVYSFVGSSLSVSDSGAVPTQRTHLAMLIIELSTVEERERSSEDVLAELRAETDQIPGVNSLTYETMQGGPSGAPIALEVTGEEMPDILAAAEDLKRAVAESAGTYDITDDFEEGRREIRIELLDSARPLGLTTRDLATEVRGAFYGLEARTLQRGTEDVDIRVRFPPERRRSLYDVESMRVPTPAGMVPFVEVARLSEARGYSSIRRVDQRRAVVVEADVDETIGNAEQIIDRLGPSIAAVQDRYPGLRVNFAGAKRETMKSLGSLKRDFLIAIGIIFVMLAGLFKSYSQPLVVLGAVPFGLNGAIFGHWLMGYPLTILSMIGLVALTGIVVNDSLILVDTINKELAAGNSVRDAVISAARRRLRPILLTSLTTILGLAPLMLEQSFQARFLIPMAISISFGLLFATVLTLLVVPALFMISVDVKQLIGFTPREELIAQAG